MVHKQGLTGGMIKQGSTSAVHKQGVQLVQLGTVGFKGFNLVQCKNSVLLLDPREGSSGTAHKVQLVLWINKVLIGSAMDK